MTTITLPPDLDERLSEEARQRGTTPELIEIDGLRRLYPAPSPEEPPVDGKTLFDSLSDIIGIVEGSGESLSEDCGRHFTDGLVEKHRRGQL